MSITFPVQMLHILLIPGFTSYNCLDFLKTALSVLEKNFEAGNDNRSEKRALSDPLKQLESLYIKMCLTVTILTYSQVPSVLVCKLLDFVIKP